MADPHIPGSHSRWDRLVAMLTDIQQHVKVTGEKVLSADQPPTVAHSDETLLKVNAGYYGFVTDNFEPGVAGKIWTIEVKQARFGDVRFNELFVRDAFLTAKGRRALTKILNGEPLDLFPDPDEDVANMDLADLKQEVRRLRAGIRQHRDATGHNLCWYVPELWGLLPEKILHSPVVPPQAEFMANCAKYRESLNPRG